jgi:L,D-transpeptidase catalytic domain
MVLLSYKARYGGHVSRRSRGGANGWLAPAAALCLILAATWVFWPGGTAFFASAQHPETPSAAPAAEMPEVVFEEFQSAPEPRPAAAPQSAPSSAPASAPAGAASPEMSDAIARAAARYAAGEKIEARHELNALLARNPAPAEAAELRRRLAEIAEEMIFSQQRTPNDPLVAEYQLQTGDIIVKVAPEFAVPADTVLLVNGISDSRKVNAGQKLKMLRGPFHLRVDKSDFRLDIYLQDLYVRSFPVGLGADPGTPEGVWMVRDRLRNPTYYPPAGSQSRTVIASGDPKNPLGGFWIGLKGVSGDAVGKDGYGVHGTNEPQSIGKNESMGCVRMLDTDAEYVFRLILEGKSTVTVLP